MTARLPPRRYSGSSELDRASTPTVGSGSATGGDPEFVENEVRALGLLIFQAAKHGSVDALRFALRCKGAKEHINYQEKTTQMTPLMAAAMSGKLQSVKLLLSLSADIHASASVQGSRSQKQTAASLATKHGHTQVAQYLQGCIDDLVRGTCTRAHMEADVISIAENPKCSYKEAKQFCSLLQHLLSHCGYVLEGGDNGEPSLLIRAAKANNSLIVYNLVEKFNINPVFSTHPDTAQNVLHFACHHMSQLRFYLASKYSELLCILDGQGNSPLHVACYNNDVEFIGWLFQGVLNGEGEEKRIIRLGVNVPRKSVHRPCSCGGDANFGEHSMGVPMKQRAESYMPPPLERSEIVSSCSPITGMSDSGLSGSSDDQPVVSGECNGEVCSDSSTGNNDSSSSSNVPAELDYLGPCNSAAVPARSLTDMKLFRKNTDGESILHVLACRGHSKLLSIVLKVAEKLKHLTGDGELGVLIQREGFTLRTPIEEGLLAGNLECVRLLVQFVDKKTKYMKKLFEDEDLLQMAILFDRDDPAKNVEAVKMLIGFGFRSGLAKSITLADMKERHDITRCLLYYQTQVQNSLKCATVHHDYTLGLKLGRIMWEGFNLHHIEGQWLWDANSAVDSVAQIFHNKISKDFRFTQKFSCKLGEKCLSYDFPTTSPPNCLHQSIVPITEINLSENHLTTVPAELFQQPHLRRLKLSHNELKELPTSDTIHRTLYSCPKLHKLELDWNKLQFIPEEFCRGVGKSLEELNLVHNELTELPPGLWVMRKLKKLKLNQNNLTCLHTLSSPRYLGDTELTQKVVMLFEATSTGDLQFAQGSDVVKDQKVLHQVKHYLTQLMSFLKTVLVMLDKDDPCANLAQAVIDVHWRRYRQPENSQSTITGCIEACCRAEEDDDEMSLVQTGFTSLQELHLDENAFTELPWDLPCVVPNLSKLYVTGNKITDLDIVHGPPSHITTLCLSKNQIGNTMKIRPTSLPCGSLLFLLSTQPEREASCNYCSHCQHTQLRHLGKLALDYNQLTKFALIDIANSTVQEEELQEIQTYANLDFELLFPRISVLNLSHNKLGQVPHQIERLPSLSALYLSGNTAITELPEELGIMNPQVFLSLFLHGVFIKNIPQSILSTRSTRDIICYLKSIREKSQTYRRIKLMVVGEANKGKTSLLLSLTRQGSIVRFREVELDRLQQPLATNGVELGDWEYAPRGRQKVTFMTWDFGGQEEYYATHQCFLTNRSLFLLVWNVLDGEAGLVSLRPWLENIEARARDSPVIVVATHADGLPHSTYKDQISKLQTKLHSLYGHSYPTISSTMHVVNCRDTRHMDQLRVSIYNSAVQYRPPPPSKFKQCNPLDTEPLLEQKIPESYVKLQDIVRSLAHACSQQNRVPVFTRQEYLCKVRESGEITVSNDELDQATSFLHSNGILLHYDDSLLCDLYFLNPQWLCSLLANVITVRERNPHVKDGIITMANLHHILRNTTPSMAVGSEVISLMQKFEVMLQLDKNRLLIPSLLPDNEATPYVVMCTPPDSDAYESFTNLRLEPPAPIHAQPDLLARYLLLPHVPNGFFPRLIARVLSSEISTQIQASLSRGPLDSVHALNNAHWECWRSGISLVWNHMEIVRIAPLRFPLPNTQGATLISSLKEKKERNALKGVEIIIAVLPEPQLLSCPILPPSQSEDGLCKKSRCFATWLLQKATELADSVLEDWYEVFGFRRGFENLSCIANPCPMCFKSCHKSRKPRGHSSQPHTHELKTEPKPLYMFSVPFCCLQLKNEGTVTCPAHGSLEVAQVSPDLVFGDFAPSALISNKDLKILQSLGEGGFGTVSQGSLITGTEVVKVAVKEIQTSQAVMNCRIPELEEETKSWHAYHSGSVEARMMYHLNHPNILSLLGVTLYPVRLVLELATEDLTATITRYQKKKKKLNRRTLKATLTQVADAMAYLHSKNILFRDLKPGNVLVWKFPLPSEQWSPDASVLLKLADYGISRQLSPQGIHSKEGTPQYLPPEVLLHSEREAASLKVDVYSFGMLMYYLFAFKNPFENAMLVASQLRSSRRPELPTKHWPHSIQMVELMTWCWSDNPNHRPTFDQILSILKSDASYSLVGGMPVSKDDEIHAACVKTVAVRRRSLTGTFNPSLTTTNTKGGPSCLRMTNVIPLKSCGIGMETVVDVWYGTITGKLNVVRYHSTGACVEPIQHPSTSYISSVVAVGDNVWVASVGCGLWVYDGTSRQVVAVWGETEKRTIYQLIVLSDSVLALTSSGMFLFPVQVSDSSTAIQVLNPSHHSPKFGMDNNVGVYVPQCRSLPSAEIWACPQSGAWLQVLSPKDISLKKQLELPPGQERRIRHIECVVLQEKCYVFVSDRHLLLRWDVPSRKHLGTLDCYTSCWTDTGDTVPLKHGRVTSLTSGEDGTLYIGNGGGMILLVNSATLEVMYRLSAYTTPVRCLFTVKMMNVFSRIVSSSDSSVVPNTSFNMTTTASVSSMSSLDSIFSPGPDSPSVQDNRSVLMSFGISYRGVVGAHKNHPNSFLLPSQLTCCTCCTHFFIQARPSPSTGYLLMWSTEGSSLLGEQRTIDEGREGEENLDGSSE